MININILKDNGNILSVQQLGRYLLEICKDPDLSFDRLCFHLYNPDQNTYEAIAPELRITSLVDVQNAIWESQDLYFPVLSESPESVQIDIYKFITKTKTYDTIYHFSCEQKLDEQKNRFKVFVLSETCLLIQQELLDTASNEMLMGHIRFVQKIVDLESLEETVIQDENLNNNGLNCIIPISPYQVMTKTGYSYMEDPRFSSRSEKDALIESVFIHTTSRFIADLLIGAISIDANLIASAYYSKYILHPGFKDEYLYFLLVDPDEESAEAVFYDVITSERLTCMNEKLDMNDLEISYVIDHYPYVKNTAAANTKFLNLKTMEFDLSALDDTFVAIIGKLFVLRKEIKKKGPVLDFYHYPDMTRVLEEKGSTVKGCRRENDYYLYIQ